MLPAAFVPLAGLPLSVNGKLDRRALPAPEEAARKAGTAPMPPRDELEGRLVALWEEVLGIAPLGVADDFHELGGHSLTAMRLMARLEKALGVRLPVSSVLEAATVERLASLLRKGRAPVRRPLVPLQARGQGRPLFLVHPVGGNVFCYRDLARSLDRSVYGLQAVPDWEPASLESLASRYLEAVQEVQPQGPYLLGGWSLGGTIAYEMARQLEGSGERVELLTMIDVAAPEVAGEEPEDAALLVRLAEDLVRLSGRPVSLGPEVLEGLDLEAGLDRLLALGRAEGVLPPDVETAQLRELFELFRRNLRAARGYTPEGYGGRITLFRAEGSMPLGTVDPTFGWERLAAIDLHRLDGDHYSLLRTPWAEALAATLERQIAMQDQEI
jgi:thioesterase domain-containing protein/acyl carrier protein